MCRGVGSSVGPPPSIRLSRRFDVNSPAPYLHWGFIQLSLANFVVIVLMVVVFALAILIPFPRHKGRGR